MKQRTRVLTVLIVMITALAWASPGTPVAAQVTPGGYDDWSCVPSAEHPAPVVLLHGLGADPATNFAYLGPALAADGYCAFASPYSPPADPWPLYGLAPIADAAADVAEYIDDVLAATGADEVDIVGHSEGGFLSLYTPKFHDVADRVGSVVALAPPTHGVDFFNLVTLGQLLGVMDVADLFLREGGCPACADLVDGGPAVAALIDGPIAQEGIDYTIIATRTDIIVRNNRFSPATHTAFVREPGVTNMYIQDRCPFNLVGHLGMALDSTTLGLIREALDPNAPRARCGFGIPF